jgi:hypothetical protein
MDEKEATRVSQWAIFLRPKRGQMDDIPIGSEVSIIKAIYTTFKTSPLIGDYSTDDTQFEDGILINTDKSDYDDDINFYIVRLKSSGVEITIRPQEKKYYFKLNPRPLGGGKKSRRKRNSKKSRKNRRKSNRRR